MERKYLGQFEAQLFQPPSDHLSCQKHSLSSYRKCYTSKSTYFCMIRCSPLWLMVTLSPMSALTI